MKQKDKKISQKIIFLLFSTFFLVGLFTFKDYGISVDEEFQRRVGVYWLNYVLSLTSFNELSNTVALKLAQITGFTLPNVEGNQYYGVIFDLPVAFLEIIFQIACKTTMLSGVAARPRCVHTKPLKRTLPGLKAGYLIPRTILLDR